MSSSSSSSSSAARCATPDFCVVRHRAAERLEVDVLARDRLDDVRAGDEHVRGLLHHEDEVGHRGGVDGAAGARSHDQRDLRDHAGALDVADEDVAVGAQRDDALLDPRAARVVDADHGAADLRGQVHDLAHLLGHDLAERAAEDGEVLGEDADAAAVDRPVAGDDGVAPRPVLLHVEVERAVAHERVELLERARIQQLLDPLARGHLAAGVLLLLGLGRGVHGRLAQLLELLRASPRSVSGLCRRCVMRRGTLRGAFVRWPLPPARAVRYVRRGVCGSSGAAAAEGSARPSWRRSWPFRRRRGDRRSPAWPEQGRARTPTGPCPSSTPPGRARRCGA